MRVEWDAAKAEKNLAKHGVDFADAVLVLEDDLAITVEDRGHDELRLVTLGTDPHGRILVVVYSWRGEAVRPISARKADRSERRQYERARRP